MKKAIRWVLLLPIASCQFIITVDTPQCEDDKDCIGLLGRDYICGKNSVCEVKEIDEPDQNQLDARVQTDASVLPERWRCIQSSERKNASASSETVSVGFTVFDFTTLEIPEGLTAKACIPSDLSCEKPVVSDVTPTPEGMLNFDLPHGFEGVFELNAPEIVTSLYYHNRPFTKDETFAGPTVVSPDTLVDISERGDSVADFNLGVAIIEIFDCDGAAGDGVHLEKLDGTDEHAFYFDGALPDRELESTTVSSALGVRGGAPRSVGGFNNIQPGYITFEATLWETGEVIDEVTAQIRPGYMTYINIYAGY